MASIAIIGAGLAGISAARLLTDQGHAVSLFDKSRSVGGRLATRRADPYRFDHGAQFFTARSREFQEFLKPFLDQGHVAPWHPQLAQLSTNGANRTSPWPDTDPHYVGTPTMNAFAKACAKDIPTHLNTGISSLRRSSNAWWLADLDGHEHGPFQWVLMTMPAPQTQALLPESAAFYRPVRSCTMTGCFALMLAFEHRLNLGFDAAHVDHFAVRWIAANHTKPERAPYFSLVIHSTHEWAETHMETPSDQVMKALLDHASGILNQDLSQSIHQSMHRWRYAIGTQASESGYWIDPKQQLGAAGDWCNEGRVEGAFLSGTGLATAVGRRLAQTNRVIQ